MLGTNYSEFLRLRVCCGVLLGHLPGTMDPTSLVEVEVHLQPGPAGDINNNAMIVFTRAGKCSSTAHHTGLE